MKIVLKRDWDVPIGSPNIIECQAASWACEKQELGHYGGRTDELNKLVNELLRRPKGSILVSGYRGVGKTSFIYKALSELRKKNNDIIIVMLNAAQLEIEPYKSDLKSIDKVNPRNILENLIRRLYSTAKDTDLDSEIKKEINLLYKTAVSAEVNITERYQKQKDFSQTIISQKFLSFSIDSQKSIFAIIGILALIFQYINIFSLDWLNKILPICIALLAPTFIYTYSNVDRENEVIARNADETYRLDNCIGNLEFNLEKIHKDIYQLNNKKIIYVIDELDKLGLENTNPKMVDEILNYLKNFFTLSNAIFIFIGDEKLYDSYDLYGEKQTQTNHDTNYRKRNYTYFTSKYFISRPLWSDLNLYLCGILEDTDMIDSELNIIKRALCFEARNDFFDIRKFINDRITSFSESNEPIIELENLYEDVLKSRFHKAITLLFDEKYMSKYPTKWRENERLIKKLFEHAYNIFNKDIGTSFEDPKDDSIDSQMTRDFNGLLESLGALHTENQTPIKLRGMNVPIRTYSYSGDIPTEPPMHLSEATEFENRYIYIILSYF
jgi:KaiC/GvpD/RAD55 family RecA-like ATPase